MSVSTEPTAGLLGWRYHETAGTKKHGPTLDKPQRKFWRYDDAWWAVLALDEDASSEGYSIFRFDDQTNSFTDAGGSFSAPPFSSVDAHLDGEDLFIAIRTPGAGIELRHLVFDAPSRRFISAEDGTWQCSNVECPSASVTTSKDGMIVVTFATDRPYYVRGSKASFPELGEPICIPGALAGLLEVDLSAAIAIGDDVALLWSDQRQEKFFCAMVHPDGLMTMEIPIAGGLVADDHIAARVLEDRLYVAVKTSRDDDPTRASDDSLLLLLVREHDGSWHHHTVARTHEPVTRPMPLIEPDAGLIHVLYTYGPNPGERSIRARSATLDRLEFAAKETVVMAIPGGQLNDVTGPPEPLTSHTGTIVASSDGVNRRYHFARLQSGFSSPGGPVV